MSVKSHPNLSTPKSSSLLDEGVQAILELRAEKQKYKELQRLLRQGITNYRDQQEAAEQAEFKFRQALKNITDISIDVDNVFNSMMDSFNRMTRYFGQPYFIAMNKRERLNYIDRKYEMWLRLSIRHHYAAIEILHKALDAIQTEDVSPRVTVVDDPTLIGD